MPTGNNNNSSNGAAAGAAEQNATAGDGGIHRPAQRSKAEDPFLFYSCPDNLERARSFREVDYGTEDALRGTIIRKTRISFEKGAVNLIMDALLEA